MAAFGLLALIAGLILVIAPASAQQGPPEDAGPPEHANAPDHAGPPDDAGPPENPGRPDEPGNKQVVHKVRICHRTNSVTNPYVVVVVDFSAADGDIVHGPDHTIHQGPVFTAPEDYSPPMNGDDWGDIIPAIEGVHEGLNWPAGEAIWANSCRVDVPEVPEDPEDPQDPPGGVDPDPDPDPQPQEEPEEEPEIQELTTPEIEVLDEVVTPPAPEAPTVEPEVEVLPDVQTRTPVALPRTGVSSQELAGIALIMLGLGALLVDTGRRELLGH